MITDIERVLLVFIADLHRTRRKFIRSKSFVQLTTFCADEITMDGCSMDRAYKTLMQWVHNGSIAFSNGWQDFVTKWKSFLDFQDVLWGLYCQIPFQSTIDINMRWFQIKILNRILYMKDSLLRFGVVTDKKCTFCSSNDETIIHVFCFCNYSNEVWSKLEFWIFRNTGERIKLTNQNKLFGFCGSNNNALNCVLMVVRQEIFSAKLRNQLPSFYIILSAVKRYYEMEKYIFQTNLRENKLRKKWFHFRKCLRVLEMC